ncbi:MAG TPA: ergothioneine biosynthesis protein EgtB [Gammaproteobacteria bacterium]
MHATPDGRTAVEHERDGLFERYRAVRAQSEALCAPLEIEDHVIQSALVASPPKWHLAHVSWFFETFLLQPFLPGYTAFRDGYEVLFNSYYQQVGTVWPRAQRGLLARPTVAEVHAYRAHVDAAMATLIERAGAACWPEVAARSVLGCHHEQQHQELLLTDIKLNFSINPLDPVYTEPPPRPAGTAPAPGWWARDAGLGEIGHAGAGFAFDNERPRHRLWVGGYRLARHPVTNGQFREFIADRGYRRPELWLADGWHTVNNEGWEAPLHWRHDGAGWAEFTLGGVQPLDQHAPVTHVSYYEADAFARWAGARLPTEAEWELAAAARALDGNFVDSGQLQPVAGDAGGELVKLAGDVWEWTASAYAPYPGYLLPEGAIGEYNGKFMCNQQVLRGGSCATPGGHLRATYRNFFYPHERWQFTGIRLARDA